MVATVTYDVETVQANFQANTFEPNDQILPDVQGLANGGYVVAYNNSVSAIVLNFYDAAGNAVGSYDVPYTDATVAAGPPSVTQMTNGNVVVVWDDNVAGDDFLQAAIYTEDGVLVRPEFDLASNATSTPPQVAALEGGGFAVVSPWVTDSIFLQIYDEDGDFVGGDFDISTTASGASEPVVAGLADGGMVVAWTVPNGANHDIVAVIFEADGTQRLVDGSLDPFVVASSGNNTQPAITALPNGNWAVAYTDSGWGNEDIGITLTIMGPDGEIVNAFEQVNPPGDPQNESDPDITVLDNGFIVVSWTYPASPGADDDIHCRIFDQDGDPITLDGSSLIVLDNTFDNEVKSAISGILAGQFVAAWQDEDGDGSGGQISATVKELVRTTTGDGTSETLNGDEIRDVMLGNGGNDTLNGFAGNDTLNGGIGADGMNGGLGNDTYVVDNAGDTASEAGGGGSADTVESSLSFTLGAGLENLTLTGSNSINGTGNGAANTLTGNSGANTLSGAGGADTMNGGTGNDTYVVNNGGDTASEAGGGGSADTVESSVSFTLGAGLEHLTLTGAANISGTGNGAANTLTGNSGANTLIGAGGADTMIGGLGNDTYVVNHVGDTASEAGGGGSADLVQSSVSFTLGIGLEHLTLTGTGDMDAIGNGAANTLIGNSGDNQLSGAGGADTMIGGAGNDTYVVNNGGDTASEAGGGGSADVVISSVSFTLGTGLEYLTLTGAANINGIGNGASNTLNGNSGANRLDGGGGNDTLRGFGAADVFVFDDGDDQDTILDFENGIDTCDLTAVAGVDEFSDLVLTDTGGGVNVDYGTGSFELANVANFGDIDASDFIFA